MLILEIAIKTNATSVLFIRRINCLSKKTIGKGLIVVKSQSDVAPVGRDVIGLEQIVPKAEREAKIYAVFVGQFFGVVPNVHLRIVENIFERPEWHVDVGMVEMPHRKSKQIDDDVILNAKPNQRQRNVLQRPIDHVFHPVVAHLCCKTHLLDGMVHLVEIPQEGTEMQQTVNEVLNKIAYDKQDKKLPKNAQIGHVENCQVVDADFQEAFIEESDYHVCQSIVTN